MENTSRLGVFKLTVCKHFGLFCKSMCSPAPDCIKQNGFQDGTNRKRLEDSKFVATSCGAKAVRASQPELRLRVGARN